MNDVDGLLVRWGLGELASMLAALGMGTPLLVSSARWADLDLPVSARSDGVRPHVPQETVEAAVASVRPNTDGLVALGGGSAIDTAKAVSAATSLEVVSIPTTYAGAEWTPYFGIRDEAKGRKGGGSGARLAGIVYEPALTLDLPRAESGGTAMNALAHAAEALYVRGHNADADRHALAGASSIDEHLPAVLADGRDLGHRTRLLEGAAQAGLALRLSGLALGHAMAQALGGRYGLPHGALNAICLPAALRFNQPVAPDAIAALGAALRTDDPIGRVEELARLAGYERLRDLGVPADELEEVAEATAERAGARANPRPAEPAAIAELLRSVW